MNYRTTIISVLVYMAFFSFTSAQSTERAGFVQGIWFNPSPFFAGEQVKINTAIQNSTPDPIVGTMEILQDNQSIGQVNFEVQPGGVSTPSVFVTFPYGNYTITARISEINAVHENNIQTSIDTSAQVVSYVMLVDNDTDGDRIGNLQDPDDDGDGFSDLEELSLGTDPLDVAHNPQVVREQQEQALADANNGSSTDTGNGGGDSAETLAALAVLQASNDEQATAIDNLLDIIRNTGNGVAVTEETIRETVHQSMDELLTEYRNSLLGQGGDISYLAQSYGVDDDGYLIVTGSDGQVYRITGTGELVDADATGPGVLQVRDDGVIFTVNDDGATVVFTPAGAFLVLGEGQLYPPDGQQIVTLGPGDTLIGQNEDGQIGVLDPNVFGLSNEILSGLSGSNDGGVYGIDDDGYLTITTEDGTVYRINQDGELFPADSTDSSLLRAQENGVVVTADENGVVYVIKPDGSITPLSEIGSTEPVLGISNTGTIVTRTSDGEIVSETITNQNTFDVDQETFEALERAIIIPGSVLFSPDVSALNKTAYAGLSFMTFVFSRWWIFVGFLILFVYVFWKVRKLVKGYA